MIVTIDRLGVDNNLENPKSVYFWKVGSSHEISE